MRGKEPVKIVQMCVVADFLWNFSSNILTVKLTGERSNETNIV